MFSIYECIFQVYPYRSIYPNAKKSEYLYKNSKREKGIRCYELMDPYINVPAIYKNDDDVDSDDDDDEEGNYHIVMFILIYNVNIKYKLYYLMSQKQQYFKQYINNYRLIENSTSHRVLKFLAISQKFLLIKNEMYNY